MSKFRKTARCALIAGLVAVPTFAFASVTGTAAAIPNPACSADSSSSALNGSHILLTNGSSTSSSSSSGTGSSSSSASSSKSSITFINGVLTVSSCAVSGRIVVQANGERYCEASATRNGGVPVTDRDPPISGTAQTCHATASA